MSPARRPPLHFTLSRADATTSYEPVVVASVVVTGDELAVTGADPALEASLRAIALASTLVLPAEHLVPDEGTGEPRRRLSKGEVARGEPGWGFAVAREIARTTGLEVDFARPITPA